MVKKKRAKKTSRKKPVKRKTTKRKSVKRNVRAKRTKTRKVRSTKNRIGLVFKNLILFVILFLVFYFIKRVSTDPDYVNTFYLLSIVMGFVALAFFIALLILLILRGMKK